MTTTQRFTVTWRDRIIVKQSCGSKQEALRVYNYHFSRDTLADESIEQLVHRKLRVNADRSNAGIADGTPESIYFVVYRWANRWLTRSFNAQADAIEFRDQKRANDLRVRPIGRHTVEDTDL
jgi:hypothetical protein